jgi:two-component system, NarL family, sensor histidine kinase DevS
VTDDHRQLLQAMFEASPDALIVVDQDGRIELASPAAEKLFGYRVDEIEGQPIEFLLPEDRRQLHESYRIDYSKDPEGRPMGVGLDLLGRRNDGSVFPVDISLAPTSLNGRLRVGAFVRDATERRRGENVLRFVSEISQRVLAGGSIPDMLILTAQRARSLVGAAVAWIAVPDSAAADQMVVAAADGDKSGGFVGASVPRASSLAAQVMNEGRTILVEDMTAEPAVLREARAADLGPGLYIPMLSERDPLGALVLARSHSEAPFGAGEVSVAEVFASAAAIVLALGSARQSLEDLRMASEQERIARDLHDTVIQRLFALGMRLQAAERLADPAIAERIRGAVDAIDQVIREIRETIFDLNRPGSSGPNLRQVLRGVAGESAEQLGFAPRLAFRGPVEAAVSDELSQHLVMVLREALSNVSRHAQASTVDVVLIASDGSVTLSVSDDGVGMEQGLSAGSGMENMRTRARQLGGELLVSGRNPAGTLLQWRVPIRT